MSQIKKDKDEKEKETAPASSSSSSSYPAHAQVEIPVKDLIGGIRADIKEMILTRDIPFSCYRGALHPEYLCDVRIVEYETRINKYEQQPDCMVDEEEYARWVSVALWTTNPGADRHYWHGIYSDSRISGINESGNMVVAIKSQTLALHNINSMCTYPLIRRNNLNADEGEYVNFWGCGRVTKEFRLKIESLNDELGLPFFQHGIGPLLCCMQTDDDWFSWCPRDISLLICSYNAPSTPEIDKNREERTSQFIIWDKEGINPLRKTCGLSMVPYRPDTLPPLPPSPVAASSSSSTATSKKRTASNVIEDEIEFSFSVSTKKRRTVLTAAGENDNDEDEEDL